MNQSRDEFIMLASHQLRTPATGVKQFIGMMIEGYGGKVTKKQLAMLKQAYDCNERQLQIANDLLRVAQVDVGKISPAKKPCNVVKLIRDILAEQQNVFDRRNQSVEFNPPRQKVVASIDPKLLYLVLEHLLDNASKYSAAGKPINLSLQQGRTDLTIIIEDKGVGIRKKDQPKLFQKFSRIDNPLSGVAGGTGLGLYWGKKIIEMHDGTLEVASKIGHGSTFTIKLPNT